jgi:alpha-tubulin suppressor-like RCC1 family protein
MWSLSRPPISCFELPRFLAAGAVLVLTGGALTGCAERAGSPTDPGTESRTPTSEATASVRPAPALIQVSAGTRHTCGVAVAGQAYCWGENESGELGNGSTLPSLVPVRVAGGHSFRQISTGFALTCAITTDNRLYCWGQPHLVGIASPPSFVTEPVPVAPTLRFQAVSAGANHSCAITVSDRRAYCWGQNAEGEVGDGTLEYRATPVPVVGGRAWRQVTTGNLHTCGITTANVAWCWGWDLGGMLGDGPTEQRKLIPVRVAGDHRFIQISSSAFHTCAVTSTGRAWCWGRNFYGVIGDGTSTYRYTPRAVVDGHRFDRVTAGVTNTCAESTTNQTYCWGSNRHGQIGTGSAAPERIRRPSLVVGGFHFVQVDADGDHTCGRTSDDVVRCWGGNSAGELGDGTTTSRSRPTPIIGG